MMQPLISNNLELYTKRVETLTCYTAISQGTQISFLKRNNEAFVKTSIHLLVEDVLNHYATSDKVVMTGIIPRIVQSILAKYWWMKMEEIAYVFNKGKNGEYGRSNKNISQDVIMDWLHQYDVNEREIEMIDYNRKLQDERNKVKLLTDEEGQKWYKEAVGIDNTPNAPDGSKRMNERDGETDERKKQYEEYKLKYMADPEAKKRNEDLLKKLDQ